MNGKHPIVQTKTPTLLAVLVTSIFVSTQGLAETQVRLQSTNESAAFSEGYALSVEDWSTQTKQFRAQTNPEFQHHAQARPQVWISDIGTLLFDDFDRDGYHSGFSLSIDVDSDYGDTEVYANIYLQAEFGVLELLHRTSRFSIYGSTVGDEYRVDTELRNNFPSNEYNVTIDIHDAWSDQLLDTANARGFSNLNQLPLESGQQNDLPDGEHLGSDTSAGLADVVITEQAGAFNPVLLLTLLGGWLLRRARRS